MDSDRKPTVPLKFKTLQVEKLIEFRKEIKSMYKFVSKYGGILDLLDIKVDYSALAALAQYYDPPLRCFTFRDFQLTPTIEKFERILGWPLKDNLPFLNLGEELIPEKLMSRIVPFAHPDPLIVQTLEKENEELKRVLKEKNEEIATLQAKSTRHFLKAEKLATDLKESNDVSWGMKKDEAHVMLEDSSKSNAWKHNADNVKDSWDAKVPIAVSSWGKPKSPENPTWDSKNQSISSWEKPIAQENQPWNSKNESNQAASSRGWDSQAANANSENDRSFQWGKQGRESFKKNRFEGSQGWGPNAGDWKNKSHPARPPGQRFDLYSSEEQDVLKDIEPIVQSIRRIMQQQGYTDGDPLPADDQKYVLENVFEHHPDKETKMGGGIDHVMVSKHSDFPESRCLYVVLKDGKKEDFSYRKCLENLVRKKYPETAESFCGKYFRKRDLVVKRDLTPNPAGEQPATPNRAGEQTSIPTPAGEQTAIPAGDQTSTPMPMETNE